MKRLVFCFDGTWNRLTTPCPTNVVLTAESVTPGAPSGIVQIIHYDQGVGTAKGQKWTGGLFGEGVLDNIVDAYTFLVFNYEIGDDIFVFGFSRGAFTARSFVGLLRNVGILRRCDAGRITEAVRRYQQRSPDEDHDSEALLKFRLEVSPTVCVDENEDAWRCLNQPGYKTGSSPVFRIRYLGVWDTVGSMGVPDNLLIAGIVNQQFKFYDLSLSDLVVSARHAVAIDEKRRSFAPTLWNNIDALNASLGYLPDAADAPYQQKWFPGTHGSVGGGGDIRGLSDSALDWVLTGARKAQLQLDTGADSKIFGLMPNDCAPLDNVTATTFSLNGFLMSVLPTRPRSPGPSRLSDVSESAVARWRESPEKLPEHKPYRPVTLWDVAEQLTAAAAAFLSGVVSAGPDPEAEQAAPTTRPQPGSHYRVVRGDTLTGLAQKAYGAASKFDAILAANRGMLDNPDRLYVGQILYIP